MTYEDANRLLGTKDMKRVYNNTWLRRKDEDTVAVQLYSTDVVLIHRDGTYTLNSGGHRTVTTKTRINDYGPRCVCQRKSTWLVGPDAGNLVEFRDGIRVNSEKKVIE